MVGAGSLWTGFRGGIPANAAARPFLFFEQENRMHSSFNIAAPDQGLAAALQQKIDQNNVNADWDESTNSTVPADW